MTDTVDTGPPPTETTRRRAAVEFILDNLVWFILIVVAAIFSAAIPNFLQIGIFLNILEQSTFVGIIAVGLSLTLIAGHMDLSIESVMAFAAMVVALTFGTGGAGGGFTLEPAWLVLPGVARHGARGRHRHRLGQRRPRRPLRHQRLHRHPRLLHLRRGAWWWRCPAAVRSMASLTRCG